MLQYSQILAPISPCLISVIPLTAHAPAKVLSNSAYPSSRFPESHAGLSQSLGKSTAKSLVTRWPADGPDASGDAAAAASDEDVFALRLPTALLANKADLLDHADTDLEVLAELEEPHFPALLVSAQSGLGLGDLGAWLWRQLGLVRVYTKAPGKPPERSRPFTLRAGEQTVEDAARLVHRDMARTLKFARVWVVR